MSHPREILPGATYLITRRALRRHMLFRPDAAITQLIIYTLAVSAKRFGIQVHALCAMSTHLHLVVSDPAGVLPSFLQYFHRLVALGTKVIRAWEGAVWDHEATSIVRLLTRAAIVEKMAYVLANPVNAGLVEAAHEWPGASVPLSDIGHGALRAARPTAYFSPRNLQWPDEVTLPLPLPPSVETGQAQDFLRDLRDELERHERRAAEEIRAANTTARGAEQACEVSPFGRVSTPEPIRDCNPSFAAGRKHGEVRSLALRAVRVFRGAYRAALEQWRAGVHDAVFPLGTWWMRTFHGARVSDAMFAP